MSTIWTVDPELPFGHGERFGVEGELRVGAELLDLRGGVGHAIRGAAGIGGAAGGRGGGAAGEDEGGAHPDCGPGERLPETSVHVVLLGAGTS